MSASVRLADRSTNASAPAFLRTDNGPAIAIPLLLGGIIGGLVFLLLFATVIALGVRVRRRFQDRRRSMGAFLAQDPDLCSLAEVEVVSVSKDLSGTDNFTYVLANGETVCVAKGNSIRKMSDSSQSSIRSIASTLSSQQKRADVTAIRKGDAFKTMEPPSLRRNKIEATALTSHIVNPREVFTVGEGMTGDLSSGSFHGGFNGIGGIQGDAGTSTFAPTMHKGYARRVRPGTILLDALAKCPAVDWGVVSAASKRAKASQYIPTAGPVTMMQRLSMSFDKILGHIERPLHIGTNPFLFPQSKSRVLKRMSSQLGDDLRTERLAARVLLDSSASRGARIASVRQQHRPQGPRLISTMADPSGLSISKRRVMRDY
jgi:hypothetical protein